MIPTALPATFVGVWQKQKVVHLKCNDFIDQRPDGHSIVKAIGTVVETMKGRARVLEQCKGIYA